MKHELEIEFKNLLTEEEYQRLMRVHFSDSESGFTQKNVYFDTDTMDLKKSKCALRIRLKGNQAELTLKTPFEGHHHETTIHLDSNEAKEIIAEGRFTLPSELYAFLVDKIDLADQDVNKLAELTTLRHEKDFRDCLLVLDKSSYSNTTDYEIELESQSVETGKDVFNAILAEFSIPKRDTPNKIARAFKEKQ
ncbi:CYTH domain-containing protein [Alkalibacterium psychrotolerans]